MNFSPVQRIFPDFRFMNDNFQSRNSFVEIQRDLIFFAAEGYLQNRVPFNIRNYDLICSAVLRFIKMKFQPFQVVLIGT